MIETALILLIALAPAIILHEVAHGWVAYQLGDPTAKSMGRLTLNPLSHIDPLGSVIIPAILYFSHAPIMFGWAKPVPVNYANLTHKRLGIMMVAAAGPLTNIILAFLAIQIVRIVGPGDWQSVLDQMVLINLTLAVFNLMPIPPLDGSRIVTGLLPWNLARRYNQLEPYGLIIIFLLLQFGMLRFLTPVIIHLANILGV